MTKFKFLLFNLSFFYSVLVSSSENNLLIWDNSKGLVVGKNCALKERRSIPFFVSRYFGSENLQTENLRNYNQVKQSYLKNYSIVKVNNNPQKRNYRPITVVGINNRIKHQNRWHSRRGDSGYLYKDSLLSLNNFVFGINLNQSLVDEKLRKVYPQLFIKDKIFIGVVSDDNYYEVKCRNHKEKFTVFGVYPKKSDESAPFLLGISDQETSIFSKVYTYKKFEAQKFLNEINITDRDDLVDNWTVNSSKLDDLLLENPTISERSVDISLRRVNDNDSVLTFNTTERVVCVESTLNVRDSSLSKVLFSSRLGDRVKIYQSWGGNDLIQKSINGVTYNFIKVQFPDRENKKKDGYIAERFIKTKANCEYFKKKITRDNINRVSITGLEDEKCCDFPTIKKPTHKYTSGMRRFGAGRDNGRRLHAACDLYRFKNEPVRSVAKGTIISELYYFYQGTYALEVLHEGGFVVRYGELTGKKMVSPWSKVKMGQEIGTIGKVNSGCCKPMLHFELYSGKKKGSLNGSGPYQRRSDLLNPTDYLIKWERNTFGNKR